MRQTARGIGIAASLHLAATLAAMMGSVQLGMRRMEAGAQTLATALETFAAQAAYLLMSPMV